MAHANEQARPLPSSASGLTTFQAHADSCRMVRKVKVEDLILDLGNIGLWVLADGVGGADAGDPCQPTDRRTHCATCWTSERAELPQRHRAVLERVNARSDRGRSPRHRPVDRGTVVCLLVFERWYCCVWAGNMRIYRLRGGQLDQLTRDHSEVQSLLDYGLFRRGRSTATPNANVITRAVGADDATGARCGRRRDRAGDAFLLCSDGLTKVVDDREIAPILSQPPRPRRSIASSRWRLTAEDPTTFRSAIVKTGGAASGNTATDATV